nr:phd finger domain-containing protein [Colletotrichum truncatum]KAF6791256.1 phd finger domain-containing protein [Colletotrichum truncatum]
MFEPIPPSAMDPKQNEPEASRTQNESELETDNKATSIQVQSEDVKPTPIQTDLNQSSPAPATAPRPNGEALTPSRYNPQFSATTQMILSRLKKGNGGSTSPSPGFSTAQLPSPAKATYEDVKRRLVEKLSTTMTLPMPTPSPTPAAAVRTLGHTSSAMSPTVGTKRKRHPEEQDVSPLTRSLPPTESPIVTRPAPKQPAKRRRVKDESMCVKCQRTSFTDANVIVACGCGEAWHQLCHEPEISEDVARIRASFKCNTCIQEDKEQARYQIELTKYREAKQEQADLRRQQHEVAKMREKRLANLPSFIKPELVGFEAGDATTDMRMDYFEGLRRTDLINLLSFSDQIKPGLLVDILVSVSKKHPDLPIFNSPYWAQPKGQPTSPQGDSFTKGTESHLSAPKASKQRSKTGGVRKILKTAPAEVVDAAADDEDDLLPPSWSKAGQGLYAKLPPEKEDTHFLVDDNDEEAFSHFLVDRSGKQIMEPIKG